MKFKTLDITNFLAIAEGKVNLADRGLVLIQGVNTDDTSAASNGAGKSSLADALCWCLYGVTARGVSGDDVINDVAAKGTKVEVVIEDNGEIYTIARHRKHKPHKNALTVKHLPSTIGATELDLTKGTDKLTQDVVNKIVGASLEVFTAAVYAGQEKMPDLPGMTDKSLKILIEEAAGVTLLEEAYKEARDRLNVEKAKLDEVEGKVTRIEDQIENAKLRLSEAEKRRDDWEFDKGVRITGAQKTVRDHVTEANKVKVQIAAGDKEEDLVDQLAKIDAQIEAVDHERLELDEHEKIVAGHLTTATVKQREKDQSATRVRSRKTALENVQHQVGCDCKECGREITVSEIAAAEKAAKDKLTEEAREYKRITTELEEAQKSLEEATCARDAFKASMTDLTAVARQRASVQTSLDAVRKLKGIYQIHANAARQANTTLDTIKAEANPHLATIETLAEALSKAETMKTDLADRIAASQSDVAHAETVVKVFSPAGVRAHILDEVTPFLNDRTTHYLSTLSDGNIEATWNTLSINAKGEYKEKFQIEVTKKSGKTFANLSGGEKRKVRVATALALQDLVATRASKQIDLFVADEIDHALDAPGLERLTQILEEKAKERGSVFVISHQSLSDWIPQIIMVTKKGEQSTVSEVTA